MEDQSIKVPDDPAESKTAARTAGVEGLREDAIHHDPLLDCLIKLTRIHGRPSTRAALTAGLPVSEIGLTPALFARAAARAGLSAKILRRPLRKIDDVLLPALLLLVDNQACVLLDRSADGSDALVLFPETGDGGIRIPVDELESRYTGIAIFSRPHFRFDARTPEVGKALHRHWFWGAFFDQIGLYRDVLYAALMINIFALAMPFFSMAVYDRILPNFAQETLWAMFAGLVLVFVVDYILRIMRGHFVDLAGSRIDYDLSALIMQKVLSIKMKDRPASVGSFASTLRSFESRRCRRRLNIDPPC
jgi:ATP-binding cassette subfamily C protein LapB